MLSCQLIPPTVSVRPTDLSRRTRGLWRLRLCCQSCKDWLFSIFSAVLSPEHLLSCHWSAVDRCGPKCLMSRWCRVQHTWCFRWTKVKRRPPPASVVGVESGRTSHLEASVRRRFGFRRPWRWTKVLGVMTTRRLFATPKVKGERRGGCFVCVCRGLGPGRISFLVGPGFGPFARSGGVLARLVVFFFSGVFVSQVRGRRPENRTFLEGILRYSRLSWHTWALCGVYGSWCFPLALWVVPLSSVVQLSHLSLGHFLPCLGGLLCRSVPRHSRDFSYCVHAEHFFYRLLPCGFILSYGSFFLSYAAVLEPDLSARGGTLLLVRVFLKYVLIVVLSYSSAPGPLGDRGSMPSWPLGADGWDGSLRFAVYQMLSHCPCTVCGPWSCRPQPMGSGGDATPCEDTRQDQGRSF